MGACFWSSEESLQVHDGVSGCSIPYLCPPLKTRPWRHGGRAVQEPVAIACAVPCMTRPRFDLCFLLAEVSLHVAAGMMSGDLQRAAVDSRAFQQLAVMEFVFCHERVLPHRPLALSTLRGGEQVTLIRQSRHILVAVASVLMPSATACNSSTGVCEQAFRGHHDKVTSARMAKDGSMFVVWRVIVWCVDPHAKRSHAVSHCQHGQHSLKSIVPNSKTPWFMGFVAGSPPVAGMRSPRTGAASPLLGREQLGCRAGLRSA